MNSLSRYRQRERGGGEREEEREELGWAARGRELSGQFKSHCIKRQEKPFNLLVTKICYLLNCAIKNENANEPGQDEAAMHGQRHWERERERAGEAEAAGRGRRESILIYHGEWARNGIGIGIGSGLEMGMSRGNSREGREKKRGDR